MGDARRLSAGYRCRAGDGGRGVPDETVSAMEAEIRR